MKKIVKILILAFVLCGISVNAFSIEWTLTNQLTVAWDAVAPVETDEIIGYYVFVKHSTTGKRVGEIPTVLGLAYSETDQVSETITFEEEGRYYIGVATYRIPPGETARILSAEINWSNRNGENTPVPFGVAYYTLPLTPINLRPQ